MIDSPLYERFPKQSVDKQLEIDYDGGTITNTEIFTESMELSESLCSQSELRFGSCEASSIKFKIANVFLPMFNNWIDVRMYLDQNSKEMFPIGRYKVFSDTPTADRRWRDIVAYDVMYDIINTDVAEWYNTVLPNDNSTVTMKAFRKSFLKNFDVAEADPDAELVNDDMVVTKTIDPSELSGKDVITAICEINGCFGHINREGKFQWLYLEQDIQGLYPANDLYPDHAPDYLPQAETGHLYPQDPKGIPIGRGGTYISAQYDDYRVRTINRVQIRKEENDIGKLYPDKIPEIQNTYIIQDNFLVYGKTDEQLTPIAKNIFEKIKDIVYRPYEAELQGNPCFEVGDPIRLVTRYELIESYILERHLKGIQALKDTFSAKGVERYSEKVNSVHKSIVQLRGKTNTLTRNVEETRSELKDTRENLQSQITQLAGQIILKVDSNGDIVQVELSASADKGSEFKVRAKNISMTADETINFMAGGDLNLTSKNITINSDKFKVDAQGNVQCNNITAFSISGNAVNQFNNTVSDSQAMQTAMQAISTAQSAASAANSAAGTAQSAADAAGSAAAQAQATADMANTTVTNLNNTIIPKINSWITQISGQLQALGQPGISG